MHPRIEHIQASSLVNRLGIFCLPVGSPSDADAARRQLLSIRKDIGHAEASGLGFAWIAEHHGDPYGGCVPDPLSFIAALGQHFNSISLGSGMTLAPLRSALLIAQQAQLVARLINSPLHLGLGRGFLPGDIQDFNLSHEDATRLFWRTVEELAELTTDDQWVSNIWIATASKEGAITAGKFGFGLALNPYTRTIDQTDEAIQCYAESLALAGKDSSYRILIHEPLFLSDTTAQAAAIGSRNFAVYLRALKAAERSLSSSGVEVRHALTDQNYADRCAFMAESEFPEHLLSWQRRGATHWCFLVRFGDMGDNLVEDTIRRCARAALPLEHTRGSR